MSTSSSPPAPHRTMAVVLSAADFHQLDDPLMLSDPADGIAVSRKMMQHSYTHAPPVAARLSLAVPSNFPPSTPFSLIPSFKKPSSAARKARRHSDSVSRSQKWRNCDIVENILDNLTLDNASKRYSAPAQYAKAEKLHKSRSDRGTDRFVADAQTALSCPDQITITDYDADAHYRTAPAHGHGHCGSRAGSSRRHGHGRSSHGQQGLIPYIPNGGAGGGSSGGDGEDGEGGSNPWDAQPIDPLPSDGKRYYACWFWLYDPVKYHACADIRKEAHHLKYNHLPQHFPNGMPPELRHRLNYENVWLFLFPHEDVPTVKDRNDKLLLMARQYQAGGDAHMDSELSFDGDTTLMLSPHSMQWQSEADSRHHATTHSLAPAHNHHGRRPTSGYAHSPTSNGRTNWDSTSSNGSSWVDLGNQDRSSRAARDYLLPPTSGAQRQLECFMRSDDDGITNVIDMNIEIDSMRGVNVPFLPMNPRIRVHDRVLREAYFWDERHPRVPFDFDRFYLVHIGDRSTGAGVLISMRSLEVLQREYFYNLAPRAGSDGYILLQREHNSPPWPR
ncbi:hypothetical protein TWF696_008478 [Orbilia brochopaga]|uniref:Uncharacterized protein n=1 Tax=Orbilia brochopaga TaxID=3140254 RepID=A0AAV9UH20_9PEZI